MQDLDLRRSFLHVTGAESASGDHTVCLQALMRNENLLCTCHQGISVGDQYFVGVETKKHEHHLLTQEAEKSAAMAP